jgi:hypothetical protein
VDHAVALVQAYLHINGYFTVTEYQVLEALSEGGYKTATDIDLLALRLPHAGGPRPIRDEETDKEFEPDPALETQDKRPDLLIIEVKEGRAELNPEAQPRGSRCRPTSMGLLSGGASLESDRSAAEEGKCRHPIGPENPHTRLRFRHRPEEGPGFQGDLAWPRHSYLRGYIEEHWDLLRHAQVKQPALGLLALLEQASRRDRE